jgi:hypothetical protein
MVGRKWDWLGCYLASTAIVLVGISFGRQFVTVAPGHATAGESFINSFFHWDGNYYREIACIGYNYHPERQSTIRFFPLYPLVARSLAIAMGLSIDLALVLTANACFAAALCLLGWYAHLRSGQDHLRTRVAALWALSFVPAGFFFRMAYSESLSLVLCVLSLYLIQRRAPALILAITVGLATAARPVGIGLVPPLLWYLVQRSADRWSLVRSVLLYLPLSCAGLLIFLLYGAWAFGDPFACVKNGKFWYMRPVPALEDKIVGLATLEPVWSIFSPGSSSFWRHYTTSDKAAFSLHIANPIYFVVSLLLMALGTWRRWLNSYEALTGWALLLIPYCTIALETQMMAMARYTTVNAPVYLVLGRLLVQLPYYVRFGLLVLCAPLLALYSALFAQWYWFL